MHPDSKPKDEADVDEVVCAEFPDPDTDPELFELVLKNMTHGPCNERCLVNGKCSKNFPKVFRETTTMDQNAYVSYRRQNTNRSYSCNPHCDNAPKYDNQWVVPYNRVLLMRYKCHINVECCASIKSVKYIHKYIYKGHDCAIMLFSDIHVTDEVKIHLDFRYISAPEGVWRLLAFKMHAEVPNVYRLQLHLEGEHSVTFSEENTEEEMQLRVENASSTLIAYFNECAQNENARQYLYQEFPQYFVWDKKQKSWKPRQKGFALGQIYYAPLKSGERFYLCTLLTSVCGPTSFENIRTVDGVLHATFKEACNALGLLENDGEWRACLHEASVFKTGIQLRRLFVTILKECSPTEPLVLWNEYKSHICDDLQPRLLQMQIQNPSEEQIYDYGLYLIDEMLHEGGKSLQDFPPMPLPENNWNVIAGNRLIVEQRNYNSVLERQLAECQQLGLSLV